MYGLEMVAAGTELEVLGFSLGETKRDRIRNSVLKGQLRLSALGLKTDFRDNGLDMFREEMVDILDADCGAARQEEKRKDLSGGSLMR